MSKSRSLPGAMVAVLALAGLPQAARAGVEIGVLNCTVAGGTGFVIGSSKLLECVFQRGTYREVYTGRINKYGLDIGRTGTSVIAWAVVATRRGEVAPGALAGGYGGVSGEATLGIGLGANALLGGSNRSIALQPLSVSAQQGLNLAVGIASLELRAAD